MTHTASDLPRLQRLHHWLTLEGWAGVSGAAAFWLPYGLVAAGLGIAAVAFTPYLVVTLWRLGRRGWLAAFAGVVGGAVAVAGAWSGAWAGVVGLLPLLVFYGYTWVLKLAVAEWVRETEETVRWAREKARWEAAASAELAGLP